MHILGCLDVPTSGASGSPATTSPALDEDQLADVRNVFIGFVFQQFNLLAYLPAWRNVELPLVYADVAPDRTQGTGDGRARHGRPRRPGRTTGRASCPAASSSASPSPGPCHRAGDDPRRRTDRQPRLHVDGRGARRSSRSCTTAGRTIVLITHEPDVAARAQRTIQIHDGRIRQRGPTGDRTRRPVRVGGPMNWRDTFRTAGTPCARTACARRSRCSASSSASARSSSPSGSAQGAKAEVRDSINALGTNLLVISPGSTTDSTGVRGGFGSASTLTAAGRRRARLGRRRTGHRQPWRRCRRPRRHSSHGDTNWTTTLTGTTASWQDVRSPRRPAAAGSSTAADEAAAAAVVVLGPDTATELFGTTNAVGRTVTLQRHPLEVIGVLEALELLGRHVQQRPRHRAAGDVRPAPRRRHRPQLGELHLREGVLRRARCRRPTRRPTTSCSTSTASPAPPTPTSPSPPRSRSSSKPPPRRQHDDRHARRHRRHLAARRRHRRHEHHARLGHRTDPRDRPAQGDRRRDPGSSAASSSSRPRSSGSPAACSASALGVAGALVLPHVTTPA